MYIDDLILSTAGSRQGVQWVHAAVSRMLVLWMTGTLRKRLAYDKLVCIAPTRELRRTLARELGPLGFRVTAESDLLGIDFSAGGALRRRRTQGQRYSKVKKRINKIRWLAKLRGKARDVARGGAAPQLTFGGRVIGLPPRIRHARRRIQAAATRVRAAGSSLTAKLALGGSEWQEAEPLVTEVAPPFITVINIIWDQPRTRSEIIDAWRAAREDMMGCTIGQRWRLVKGPVSAAHAHLQDIEVEWKAPFTITALGRDICLITTPPKQITMILQ